MLLTIGAWPHLARGVGIEPTKDGFGDLPVPSTPRLVYLSRRSPTNLEKIVSLENNLKT